jgi:mono/diheme cytochrome c family protein
MNVNRSGAALVADALLILALGLGAAGCSRGTAAPAGPADLYAAACARCHGAEGRGGIPSRPGGPAPRDLGDPVWQAGQTDKALARTIARGKGEMPGFSSSLSADQIEGLVGYLRTFQAGARGAAPAPEE